MLEMQIEDFSKPPAWRNWQQMHRLQDWTSNHEVQLQIQAIRLFLKEKIFRWLSSSRYWLKHILHQAPSYL